MSTPRANATERFERDTSRVLQHLRSAIAGVIDALPDRPTKSVELHRNLNLDKMLSWRLLKVVGAQTPLEAGPHVPSPANMRTFLKTAAKRGIPDPLLNALEKAKDEFEQFIHVHAGSRATFDSMVSMLADGEDAAKINLQHKRAAYRAQRHIFGVYARTQLKCLVIRPSENPLQTDVAKVEGFVDLRPLRANARMVISHSHIQNDDGSVRIARGREPLDAEGQTDQGLALVREFCSAPLPEFAAVEFAPGRVQCELIGNGIGEQATLTCIEGHVFWGEMPRYQEPNNFHADHRVRVRLPCEVLLLDLLMHRSTYEGFGPASLVYGEHLTDLVGLENGDERDRLRLDENITCLGQGAAALRTPDYPRYVELGEHIFDRLGWNGEEFDAYRCRIEYPVIPSLAQIRYALPEVPADLAGRSD